MTRLPDALAGGDYTASLSALREALEARVAKAGPRDVAAIAKQLGDFLRELAELPDGLPDGYHAAALTGLRDLLATRLEDAGARDVAPIAKQLADFLRELEAMKVPEEISLVDEIARRRADRLAASALQQSSA